MKELFWEHGLLRGPWVKGISSYLKATERDLLGINSFKGETDPVEKNAFSTGQESGCVSRWVVGGFLLATCPWDFLECWGLWPWDFFFSGLHFSFHAGLPSPQSIVFSLVKSTHLQWRNICPQRCIEWERLSGNGRKWKRDLGPEAGSVSLWPLKLLGSSLGEVSTGNVD